MSDTLHLACVTCRVQLWIGQGGYSAPAKAFLYGTDEAKAQFAAFYDGHMGHDVRLTNVEGLYKLADHWFEFQGGGDGEPPVDPVAAYNDIVEALDESVPRAVQAELSAICVTGFRNPAKAAAAYIRAMDVPWDESSFDRLAGLRGDASPEDLQDGFIVKNIDDLQRVCQIGEFSIIQIDGQVTALLPEELPQSVDRR